MIDIERAVSLEAPVSMETLRGVAFTQENAGHRFLITGYKGGEVYPFSGSATAYVIRSDGTTLMLGEGSTTASNYAGIDSDGRAWVKLHPTCYDVVGRIQITLYVTESGGSSTCVYACYGNILRSTDGEIHDPGPVIPTSAQFNELMVEVRRTIGENEYPVSYHSQSLLDTDKATARSNIGAASADDPVVLYSVGQGLSSDNQQNARDNIGIETQGLGLLKDITYKAGTATNGDLRMERTGIDYAFSGSIGAANSGVYFKLNGTLAIATSTSSVSNFGTPVNLGFIGRRFRARLHPISGSVTCHSESALRVAKVGTYAQAGTFTRDGDDWVCDFTYTEEMNTAGGVQLLLVLIRKTDGVAFDDLDGWNVQVTLQDITETAYPPAPTAQGTYTLQCTVSAQGVPAYAWIAAPSEE